MANQILTIFPSGMGGGFKNSLASSMDLNRYMDQAEIFGNHFFAVRRRLCGPAVPRISLSLLSLRPLE
jgi:hypothetical protein